MSISICSVFTKAEHLVTFNSGVESGSVIRAYLHCHVALACIDSSCTIHASE